MKIRHVTFYLTLLALLGVWLTASVPAADDLVDVVAQADEADQPEADLPDDEQGDQPRDERPHLHRHRPPTSQPDDIESRVSARVSGHRMRSAPVALTDQQEAETLEFLQKHQPGLADRLAQTREKDPEDYRRQMARVYPATRYWKSMQDRDPEVFNLIQRDLQMGRKIRELSDELANAREPERRSELEFQIREQLAKRFDVSQERRRIQIDRLAKQVELLVKQMKIRAANKDSIVESQMQEILQRIADAKQTDRKPEPAAAQASAGGVPTSQPD